MGDILQAFTGPDSGSQASSASRANKQQQAAIDYGLQELNAIYGGGSYPIYSQAGGPGSTFVPGTQYYKSTPGGYVPITFKTTGDKGKKIVPKLGRNIFTATQSPYYQGFQPNFYQNYANSYVNYAMPQLGQQYQQAGNALQLGLANKGLLGSSAAKTENQALQQSYGQQQQGIADTSQNLAQQLRSQVNQSYQNAVAQLYNTANPANAQQSALAAAAQFTAPSAFAPLANGFANLVNQYTLQQQIAGLNSQAPAYYDYGASVSGNPGALPSN